MAEPLSRQAITACHISGIIVLPYESWAGAGWAFPGQIDGHLSPHALGSLVSALLPPGVSMHSLRHTFATTCYRATGDILAVSRLLGHSSVATTMRYVELDPGRLRAVAARAA